MGHTFLIRGPVCLCPERWGDTGVSARGQQHKRDPWGTLSPPQGSRVMAQWLVGEGDRRTGVVGVWVNKAPPRREKPGGREKLQIPWSGTDEASLPR